MKRQTAVKKKTAKAVRRIAQRLLPTTYLLDGSRMASLGEMLDPHIPTKMLNALTLKEEANLVAHRLQAGRQPFRIRFLGFFGALDGKQAVREVRAFTPVGRHLIDIEKRFIRLLAEREVERKKERARARNR